MRAGFTLLEISVVLIIIALVIGGIIVGQNMVRAAELNSAIGEYQTYTQAIDTFYTKYESFPGDMPNATSFWGAATCPTTAGTGTDTCNGNGNRIITQAAAAGEFGEAFTFWQHLANAELIAGQYTGMSGAGGQYEAIGDENSPSSAIDNAIWGVNYWATMSGDTELFDGEYGNTLRFGGEVAGAGNSGLILTPGEAYNFDKKMDDGWPARGNVVVRQRVVCTNATAAVADSNNFDSVYSLSNDIITCGLLFRDVF